MEPIYIKPEFVAAPLGDINGRGVFTKLWIWKHGEWKVFLQIYRSHFCGEDCCEALKDYMWEYRNIWSDICRDNQINLQFNTEIHANTDDFVSWFSPNFENKQDYNQFCVQREKEEKERERLQEQTEKKRESGKKRKLTDVDGTTVNDIFDNDTKRRKE